MIRWLLLISLLCQSTQDGTGQETGVLQCRPQNTTLTGSDQTITLTWDEDPSCSAVHDVLIYELVVLIAEKQDEVAVMPDQIGSTHSWSWTSDWALQCASHSVRLSSRYKLQTSPWKLELALPGVERSMTQEVYPKDRVYEVGSTITFCCVLSEDQIFDKIYLSGYDSSSSSISTFKISNQTYVVTVFLNQPSTTSCTDVKCKARSHDGDNESGACVFIGYPPGDKDLQCETRDLESIDCHWTIGRNTHLPTKPTTYYLLGSRCSQGSRGRCSQKVKVDVGETNWTLTARNDLGTVELSDRADLTKRVHMFAPEGVTASSVNARNVSLEWGWKLPQYNRLNITCQVNVSDGTTNTMSESSGVGLNSAVVTNLIPNWSYSMTVRCGTAQHLWKWSDWSSRFNFHTKGDVPDALDVWMQMKDSHIIIIWKMPLANQSHGHITDYEVTWTKTTEMDQENRITVPNTKHTLNISVNTTEEHLVTVTARNNNGSSPPSTITAPHYDPDTTRVNTSRISGSNGGFILSWSASLIASCGYTVDWCPSSGHGSVQWIKIPPHETNATIFSEDLKDGVRYLLSIYACTQGAPVLLERREGYIREKKIQDGLFTTKCKQQDTDLEVSWDPLPLTQLTAFIQGYILYWTDNNNVVFNVSTDDPEATSLTARNLKISSYMFSVKALTAVGEGGTVSFSATLDSQTDKLIKAVVISLLTVSLLLPLITVVCYRHWGCIKQKVYPPIPKPLLSDTWLTSPGERSCHPLYMEVCHHSEADIMDIPELQSESVKDYVSHEKTPFVFSQTPKGYYNQPLKKCTPPTTTDPSLSVLPHSPLRSVFPNLSYNLIMQTGDQQCGPQPEQLEVTSGGYQPQNNTETFTLNQAKEVSLTPMTCISTYISLPQSPSQ